MEFLFGILVGVVSMLGGHLMGRIYSHDSSLENDLLEKVRKNLDESRKPLWGVWHKDKFLVCGCHTEAAAIPFAQEVFGTSANLLQGRISKVHKEGLTVFFNSKSNEGVLFHAFVRAQDIHPLFIET